MEIFASAILLGLVYYFVIKPIIEGYKEGAENVQYEWPELGMFEFEVVGESNYQTAIEKLTSVNGGEALKALLIPEDNNRYDKKAIRVDINGMTVGYLSRQDATSFRRRLSQKNLSGQVTSCAARIYGGGKTRDGGEKSYGIWLDVKPFDE